ncbi:hypothetical protein GcC1_057003 [Golovinomyces cichoracearum]|uniref:Uncharacterized protein n=1 Tax=Golovinomyces cichoracearum TaxID=62708 RepID=A0A420IUS7_9PEZI|nr:hypothetical protein GcC1_057003 [Golovinomyces cichoracearum]
MLITLLVPGGKCIIGTIHSGIENTRRTMWSALWIRKFLYLSVWRNGSLAPEGWSGQCLLAIY